MSDMKPVEAWAGRRPDGTICFGTIAGTDEACHAAIRERELALEGHNYYKPEPVMIVPLEQWEAIQKQLQEGELSPANRRVCMEGGRGMSDLKDFKHAAGRCIKALRLQARESRTPGDPYGGLMFADDAETLSKGLEQIARLQNENRALREAIVKYGRHVIDTSRGQMCELLKHSDHPCTCGFNKYEDLEASDE